MSTVTIRAFLSPTLVLLAFDWPDGARRDDFLGFAIQRTPGFDGAASSWLPNRISFNGPAPNGGDLPSDGNPVQKFQWWDARIGPADRGRHFTYRVWPVVGTPGAIQRVEEAAGELHVTLPQSVEHGIGTWFNRAVVSSQAFVREFGHEPRGAQLDAALEWLGNGLPEALRDFVGAADGSLEGAIYHLTDQHWAIPALAARAPQTTLLAYNDTATDHTNADVVRALTNVEFFPRTKASIMHDKLLVSVDGNGPERVLMGSANFTTEGLTTQANLLHTFASPQLAALYRARAARLRADPPVAELAAESGWSDPIHVGDAHVRVVFSPEVSSSRASIDAVVQTVQRASSSVLFCLFDPTDTPLLDAIFAQGDAGKMMFGLVNHIPDQQPGDRAPRAEVEVFHRSREQRDVVAHGIFPRRGGPEGFWWEDADLPGGAGKFPVYIHHKFVIVDAETDHPTIYTGSANMSNNSLHHNDENLLEITGSPRLAHIYLAEFMRLYEHYRARAAWERSRHHPADTFALAPDASWARKFFTAGSPEAKSRVAMAGG